MACALRKLWRLRGTRRRVYELCDRARGVRDIGEVLAAEGDEVSATQVEAILRSFVEARLMICENGRYLALATEAGESYRRVGPSFPGASWAPLEAGAASLPRRLLRTLQNEGPRLVLAKARLRLREAWTRRLVGAACALARARPENRTV